MSKYRFDISQSGFDTIMIEADDGWIIDDWKDLTAPSCLIMTEGNFKIEADKVVFSNSAVEVFRLLGTPFEASVGATGESVIELSEHGCPNVGWQWKLISRP